MKKYLPILLLIACNSSSENVSTITVNPINDSISLIVDSLKEWTDDLSDVSSYAIKAQARIKQLEKEKQATEKQIETYPMAINSDAFVSDDRDKVIAELRKKVYDYENQIAALKNQLSRNKIPSTDRVENKPESTEIRPNENSIILQLDRRMKNDGDIPLETLSVYIIPYNKKAKKWKEYGYCSGLDGKQAEIYNGQFFFNDVPPGKYLIKVCTYLGGYKIIERTEGLQVVAMQVAPPIQ